MQRCIWTESEEAAYDVQDDKRQKKAEHSSQKQVEASSSASMDPVLATVAKPSKERKRALQKERAAERERASVQKQRAEWWQGFKRLVLLPRGLCCCHSTLAVYHAGLIRAELAR